MFYKKNILLSFLFLLEANCFAQESRSSGREQSYDEFKDKNIEFSLDDGDNESKFQFEDQSLINKRMKELEAKKAARLSKIKKDIAEEELTEARANRLALMEKNSKLYDFREKRLIELKEHRNKVQGIFSLNLFHQYRRDTNFNVQSPKIPEMAPLLIPSTGQIITRAEDNAVRHPAFVGRVPAEKDISNNTQQMIRKPQSITQTFLQNAKEKVFLIYNRIKAWFK